MHPRRWPNGSYLCHSGDLSGLAWEKTIHRAGIAKLGVKGGTTRPIRDVCYGNRCSLLPLSTFAGRLWIFALEIWDVC